MDISKVSQLEMLLSFLRQKAAECGDAIKMLPGFDGDTEIALLLDNKKAGGFFIFTEDSGMLQVLFESLQVYYTNKAYAIEAQISALKKSDAFNQTMPI